MKRVLIVCYSRTGYTRRIADELAALCHAELEIICENRNRAGLIAYLMSAYDAMREKPAALSKPVHDPADFDLVIIGTPVWAGQVSTPVLSYLQQYGGAIRRYAAFCTEGGANGEKVLARIAAILDKPAEAKMVLTDKAIDNATYRAELAAFAEALSLSEQGDAAE